MSFPYRPRTPTNAKVKFLTEYRDYPNTFNNAGFTTFRDRLKKGSFNKNYINYKPNPYASFLKSSAPFKYYNNEKDKLLVCYNGGPRKEFRPLITRENLAKFLRNRSATLRYRKPCGCFSNYNLQKYQSFKCPCKEHYNTFYQKKELPQINDNDNIRYNNILMTPPSKNRTNGKITYKLKNNFNSENYRINTESNNYENDKIRDKEAKEEDKNNAEKENKEEIIEKKKEENVIEKRDQKPYKRSYYNFFNISNIRPRVSFHKIQIFNNCKPFLVDDFKDYGYYE